MVLLATERLYLPNEVSDDGRQFATQVRYKNISISFLTKETIEKLEEDTNYPLTTLCGESRQVYGQKRLSLGERVEEEDEPELGSWENKTLEKYKKELGSTLRMWMRRWLSLISYQSSISAKSPKLD
jgi:hypothetical protein